MVPYVRKSFFKHYKDGLKYVETFEDARIQDILDNITAVAEATHDLTLGEILEKEYGKTFPEPVTKNLPKAFEHTGIANLSIEDDVYKEYPKAFRYATDMTVKEINQAVEALFHNLNIFG